METKELLKNRRSVNFFDSSKKVSDSLIKEIVELASYAPSAFNLQPWRLLIVKSEEAKNKLLELSNKQPKVKEAAFNVIIIGNKEGYSDSNPVWAEMLKTVGGNQAIVDGAKQAAAFLYGSSDERKIKFAESNAGLFSMSIMIAAKEYGVDSHPMSGLDFEGIHKEFGLSNSETVVMNIAFGYFDSSKELNPRRPRLGFDEIATFV